MKALAIITGGTSGIGLATARRLQAGYRLALVYAHDHTRAARAAESTGGTAFDFDLGQDGAVSQGYRRITDHFGQIPEILVQAAGLGRFQRFFVQTRNLDSIRECMNLNYYGCVRMAAQVVPDMVRAGRGKIVNVTSVSGLGGNQGVIGYAESKAALACFSRNLASELAPLGVCVSCLAPGRVLTPMTQEFLEQFEPASINQPLGRPLTPEEVALALETMLAAGPLVQGQQWVLDGGTSIFSQSGTLQG